MHILARCATCDAGLPIGGDERADAFRIEIRFGLAGAQPGLQLPPKRNLEIAWLGIEPADLWQPPPPTT